MTPRALAVPAAAAALLAAAGCSGPLMRSEAELAQRSFAAPDPVAPAVVARQAAVRTGPDAATPVKLTLAAGTEVRAADQVVRGHRRIRTADGQSGWIEASALSAPAAQAAAPSAAGGGAGQAQ
ncbi:MAG TPA: SH3 domain-containing protein [Anaeromyxobacteraceae bacterium]|nr:SH3 domain-containing protein [Anaeromyxobacteraceae bacterium]